MPRRLIHITLLSALLAACETDPDIYIDSAPQPVIFGVINASDSVHYLKVGRTFGARSNPRESVGIFDSLYFPEVQVEVNSGRVVVERVTDIPKDSGLFLAPDQVLYRFAYLHPYRVEVKVKIPGLPEARARTDVVRITRLTTPIDAQMYFYLVPTSPIRVHWDGNPWNEIDVRFEIIEILDEVPRSRWVHIQNKNFYMSAHALYREMSITYEEFLTALSQQLPRDPDVDRRRFGNIRIEINGGDANMVSYIRYYNGYTDFNTLGYTNVTNGIGVLASRCSFIKDSMHFDYHTIQGFLAETRMRYLKLDPYQEK